MTNQEMYELCKATSVRLNKETGNLEVSETISAELIDTLRANKADIVEALSGYCFSHDVCFCDHLRTWKIVKASTSMGVAYNPVTVFVGNAVEVDDWARENRKDPFFTDRYTSKYSFVHEN